MRCKNDYLSLFKAKAWQVALLKIFLEIQLLKYLLPPTVLVVLLPLFVIHFFLGVKKAAFRLLREKSPKNAWWSVFKFKITDKRVNPPNSVAISLNNHQLFINLIVSRQHKKNIWCQIWERVLDWTAFNWECFFFFSNFLFTWFLHTWRTPY